MRLTSFSVGRRWRCARANAISFDFVIIAKMTNRKVYCRIEPLPNQEHIYGKERLANFGGSSPYSMAHIKKCAVLVPLSLDDFTTSITK